MDAVNIVDEDVMNRGLVSRRAHVTQSRVVDMMGRLHVDLFLQDRYLLNGVDVKIRLVRSKDTFALMAGGGNLDYKVHIVNATMFARKATLYPSDGAHQGTGQGHGQVPAAFRRLQSILHSHRGHVAHARKPVPRYPTETSGTMLHRQ